ncbi:MAG: serine/threonine protein kinase [Pyrinomonadaceae bacterium]|nr:serine/threonine protein kinase [Pyrinomonadaceae bacterium]
MKNNNNPFVEPVLPGTRINDFTIAYRIARGMCADVFAVWHHALRTPLVCKRLRPEDAGDQKWRRMLQAEGTALQHLSHPGIVRLIEFNRRDELPYLLLEHVGERTLRDTLIKEKAFAPDYAVRIVQHVGAAVQFAHERGFIHRDLKPSNIMLRGGRPLLLDFGVVWRWKSARRPPDRSGTPQYLAPEQIMREPLTPQTDVYGLGVLLFELIAGARPFSTSAERHNRDALLHLRYPQLREDAPDLNSPRHKVSRKLREIVRRCLLREPQKRFSSAEELIAALDSSTRIKIYPRNVLRAQQRCSAFSATKFAED